MLAAYPNTNPLSFTEHFVGSLFGMMIHYAGYKSIKGSSLIMICLDFGSIFSDTFGISIDYFSIALFDYNPLNVFGNSVC